MADDNQPYIIPLNFGYVYKTGILTLYFHGAYKGMKIDILKKMIKFVLKLIVIML